jgi:hypothetical protein
MYFSKKASGWRTAVAFAPALDDLEIGDVRLRQIKDAQSTEQLSSVVPRQRHGALLRSVSKA